MKKALLLMVLMLGSFMVGLFLSPTLIKKGPPLLAKKAEKKILYWVAPMDANYRRDKPGKSPMGMDLVPVYEKNTKSTDDASIVNISSEVINKLGVKTKRVESRRLKQVIHTVGLVRADEENIESVNVFVDGWIRHLKVNAEGESVKKGQVLFDLYSPTLVQAQQEYLLALESQKANLIKAGEQKLRTLGLSLHQIKSLRKSRQVAENIPIFAASSGVVLALNIRDGMFVKPNANLMMIEDLSFVWVRGSIYEKDASLIKRHQRAVATFTGLPGVEWLGQVAYIYPILDKMTHTLSIRLKFPNPGLTLKPNMYANIRILVNSEQKSLLIPRSSVIPTGHGPRVILSLGGGKFKPQEVTLGREEEAFVEVLSGLKQTDNVVVSGQFLIDSESNLNASFKRMSAPSAHKGHHHHHHMMTKKVKEQDLKYLRGKVLSIDAKRQRVTVLLKEKISPMLNKPNVILQASVNPEVSFNLFKKDEEVLVILVKKDNSQYQIESAKPVEPSKKERRR